MLSSYTSDTMLSSYTSDTMLSSYTILNSQSTIHFTSLSVNELLPDLPLTSSFCTFPTFHSHLPKLLCITYKSSHSRWYHASAPHSYISLLTTIVFHPSLPITYLLPDRSAAYVTISISPFAYFIRFPMLLKPPCFPPSIVIPKYLYSSTSPIQQSPIIHLHLPTLPFMHTTLDFFSLTFKPYSTTHSLTFSIISYMSFSLLAIRHT